MSPPSPKHSSTIGNGKSACVNRSAICHGSGDPRAAEFVTEVPFSCPQPTVPTHGLLSLVFLPASFCSRNRFLQCRRQNRCIRCDVSRTWHVRLSSKPRLQLHAVRHREPPLTFHRHAAFSPAVSGCDRNREKRRNRAPALQERGLCVFTLFRHNELFTIARCEH